MTLPKILVTGAGGKSGGAVVSLLRERDYPVRAVVRKRDARSQRLEALGAEVVVADLFDPEGLTTAMRGTTRAYYCPPFDPYMIQSAMAFAAAAKEAKLETIVGMSQWLASPSHPSIGTRQHWLIDRLFSSMPDFGYTIVNPGYFADNTLRLMDFAAFLGVLPVVAGLNAPPSNEDIARVVVGALMAPERHAGKSYRPTGPALLSGTDMAATVGKVLGHKVRALALPTWMLLRAARIQRVDPFLLAGLRFYIEDHVAGAFAFGGPTEDVLEVTGRPAESFETTARRYAAMPFTQKTLANRLRTIANFALVPIVPGYDLDGLIRRQGQPAAVTPQFAMESERWKTEHTRQPRVSVDAPVVAPSSNGHHAVVA